MADSDRVPDVGIDDYMDDEELFAGRERIQRRDRSRRRTESQRSLRKGRQIPLSANGRSARRSTFRALRIGKIRAALNIEH